MANYCTAAEIEIAVARWFNPRAVLVVPNVSWGLGVHECDLLIVSRNNYASEVEIKVTHADLRADAKKRHKHESHKIKRLWFALPEKLEACLADVPERAGVLLVGKTGRITVVRKPVDNCEARALSNDERLRVARLGAIRIWDLKERIRDLRWLLEQTGPAKKEKEHADEER